MRGKFIRDITG